MKQRKLNPAFLGNRSAGVLTAILVAALGAVLWATAVSAQEAPQASAQSQYDYASQTLRVGVWVDRDEDEVYRRGDEMEVNLQTNADAYVVVYRIDADGLVSILWPRTRLDDGFVFGGHDYQLPVTGGPRLRVSEDEGLGYVEAIASSYPFDLRDLEIDFHHEQTNKRFDFYVAGDPFLAMNEVNFAVTGLEDAADYVVTNYASYYVHEKVDHPRYLCAQCHTDGQVDYDPYVDHCSLQITYDYGWSNRWYVDYGYYPVYWHPIYVYYDPWTWRPWVNYWYHPYYSCPPYPGYHWRYSAYFWNDSPYYWGDVYHYRDRGYRHYRPLGHVYDGEPRRKLREYASVSPLVKGKLSDNELVAMRTRTSLDRGTTRDGIAVRDGDRVVVSEHRGEKPMVRPKTDLQVRDNRNTRSGLQIRDNSRPTIRHTSGGSTTRPGLSPVRTRDTAVRGDSGTAIGGTRPTTNPGVKGEKPTPQRRSEIGSDRTRSTGTIQPVEPRKKGTRVWNRGSYDSSDGSAGGSSRSSVKESRSSGSSGNSGSTRSNVRDSRSSDSGSSSRSGNTSVRRESSKSTPEVKSSRSSGSSSSGRSSTPTVKSSRSSDSGSSSSSRSSSSSSGSSRSRGSGNSGGSSKRR